jgi:hypothetical protein
MTEPAEVIEEVTPAVEEEIEEITPVVEEEDPTPIVEEEEQPTLSIEDIVAGEKPDEKKEKGVDKTPKWAKDRFDALTRKIYEKDARIKELEQAKPIPETPTIVKSDRPLPPIESDFVDSQEYIQARVKYEDDLDAWKTTTNREREDRKQREEEDALNAINFDANANRMRAKYEDFDDALNTPLLTTSNVLDEVIASEHGPEIGYFLAKNPNEALRFSKLSERQLTREIAKLEVKFSTASKKVLTDAPKPIVPIHGDDIVEKDMSKITDDAEWHERYKQQQLKKIKS